MSQKSLLTQEQQKELFTQLEEEKFRAEREETITIESDVSD